MSHRHRERYRHVITMWKIKDRKTRKQNSDVHMKAVRLSDKHKHNSFGYEIIPQTRKQTHKPIAKDRPRDVSYKIMQIKQVDMFKPHETHKERYRYVINISKTKRRKDSKTE